MYVYTHHILPVMLGLMGAGYRHNCLDDAACLGWYFSVSSFHLKLLLRRYHELLKCQRENCTRPLNSSRKLDAAERHMQMPLRLRQNPFILLPPAN